MNGQISTNTILIYSTATTAVVMIVLFAMAVVPLWLAAVVIVADAAFAWAILQAGRDRA